MPQMQEGRLIFFQTAELTFNKLSHGDSIYVYLLSYRHDESTSLLRVTGCPQSLSFSFWRKDNLYNRLTALLLFTVFMLLLFIYFKHSLRGNQPFSISWQR